MAESQRFDKFSERARRVLTLAQEEAQRFNHNYIGTEHLLLGLIREEGGVAAKVLANLHVEVNKTRSATEFIIGRGDRAVLGEIGLTPRGKKVIELSLDEAHRLNHSYVGTEHLLLGLVREGEGVAAGVLESLGVNLERVRAEMTRVLAAASKPPPAIIAIRDLAVPPKEESTLRARPRPNPVGPVISTRLSIDDTNRLYAYAEKQNVYVSQIMREALIAFLNEHP